MKQKFQRFLALLVLAFVGIGAAWAMDAPERLRVFGESLQDPNGNFSGWDHWNQDDFWSVNKRTVSYGIVFDFNLKFHAAPFKFRVGTGECDEYGADNDNWREIGLDTEWTIKKATNNLKAPTGKDLSVSVLFPYEGNDAKITIKEGYNNFAYDYVPPVQTVIIPDELYIRGHVTGYTENNWDNTTVIGTRDGNKWTFPGSVLVNGWSGNATFNFVGKKDGVEYCWKSTGSQPVISNYPFYSETTGGDYKVNRVDGRPGGNGWQVRVDDVKNATITLDFSGSNPNLIIDGVTVDPGNHAPFYYVGDMNDWFSTEFSAPEFVGPQYQGQEGMYKWDAATETYIYSPSDGDKVVKTGNFNKVEDLDNWKFEWIGALDITVVDGNGNTVTNPGNNWYKFDGFPGAVLTGQFKIYDGAGNWGSSYSNAVGIEGAGSRGPWWDGASSFTAYYDNSITRKNIANNELLGSSMVKRGTGQNFFLESGGVKDATVYFTPDDGGKLIVSGTPIDYYVFYGLSADDTAVKKEVYENGTKKTTEEDWVRAIITADKPNVNNYFLPGIWYGATNGNGGNDGNSDHIALDGSGLYYTANQRMPLPAYVRNADGSRTNVQHMNMPTRIKTDGTEDLGGQDLVRIDLRSATLEEDLKKIMDSSYSTTDPESNEKIIERIVNEKTLPDGRNVSGYDYIWIQKIPSGFEAPAGKSYTLSFNKSRNSYTKDAVYTIRPEHMYFFNGEPAHLHVDYSDVARFFNVKVEYRVFTYDARANVVVASPDHNDEGSTVIYNTNQTALQPTEKETGLAKTYGWVELKDKGNCHQQWCNGIHTHEEVSLDNYNWNYKAHAVTRATDADTDVRHAVNQKYGKASIQLKVTYTKKDGVDYNETAWKNPPAGFLNGEPVVFYTPAVLNPDDIDPRLRFDMKDKYLVMKADDPVMTGIEDITIEDVDFDTDSDATPVYYNLQGVRVANPSNGIFIEVRGSKSSKVYIK